MVFPSFAGPLAVAAAIVFVADFCWFEWATTPRAVVLAALFVPLWLLVFRPLRKTRPQHVPQPRAQRPRDYPPPYPNGWFCLALSDDVRPGEVVGARAFGQKLVLFRNKRSGRASVLDAFCPHLGADLSQGGTVTDSGCIRCPFHGWEFDGGSGECTKIEGTDCIPSNSSLQRWHSVEANGAIHVWFHAEGSPPDFDIDRFAYIDSGRFYLGGWAKSFVNTHIREIPENGADSAHLNVLHRDFVVPWLRPFGLAHTWTAAWAADDELAHKSQIHLTQAFMVAGFAAPGTHIETEISQIGPGVVSLLLRTPIGRIHVFEYVTPIAPLEQRVAHVIFCDWWIPQPVANFMLWALDEQFHRDQPIWESKRMATRPIVSKADGPILEFRRWWQRFYTGTSLSFADAVAKESMMDW